MSHIITP